MFIGLFCILILTLFLPLLSKKVEHNLEVFLFIVGTAAALISRSLSFEFYIHILENKFIYMIGFAVFAGGVLFKVLSEKIRIMIEKILKIISLKVFVFFMVLVLGFISSVITAIIAALLLVEIVNLLPLSRKRRVGVTIISCFSIGLGAVLTPIGEPLSTVVTSKLNGNFWFLYTLIGKPIIISMLGLALFAAWYAKVDKYVEKIHSHAHIHQENYADIVIRTLKIIVFIIALELLGAGFKPIIDAYVINLDGRYLYWINTASAVLDNATLASAEISARMDQNQVKAVLIGLLISGGMLIPGNIPNIISANKLKIKSSEWIKVGIPLGTVMLLLFFVFLFFI